MHIYIYNNNIYLADVHAYFKDRHPLLFFWQLIKKLNYNKNTNTIYYLITI